MTIYKFGLAFLLMLSVAGCSNTQRQAADSLTRFKAGLQQYEPLAALALDLDAHERDLRIAELLREPIYPAQIIELLLINSPHIRAELAGLGIAQAQRLQAGMISNPRFASGALRPEGGGRWQLDAGISQSILDWFTRPLRDRLAEAELAAAQLELHGQLNRALFTVQQHYFQVLAARQLVEVRSEQLKAAEANHSLASSLYTAGNIPQRRLLQYQLEVQAQERQWQQAQAVAQQQQIVLAGLLGLASDASLLLPDKLPPLPAQERFDATVLYPQALAQRVDLQLAQARLQAAEQNLALQQKTGAFTELELGANLERETDGSYMAGPEIALSLPLFDRGHARRFGAEAAVSKARELLTAKEIQIENDIASTLLALTAARERAAQIHTHSLPLQRKVQALQLREYNFMLASAFDLILLKRQEFELQEDYVKALQDYWLARSELALVLGQSFIPDFESQTMEQIAPDTNTPEAEKDGIEDRRHTDHSMHHHGGHHYD